MKTDVNRVEDLADALVDNMPYADNSVLYPEFDTVKRDDGVFPEWFYPAMSGINDFSELNSILMYTRQNTKFDDIGELLLGIALVEMKHYDKLQDFIKALGGNVDRHYSSTKVETGSTSVEALRVAIKAERAAIAAYHKVQNQLNAVDRTATVDIARDFVYKLICDENRHEQFLVEKLVELTGSEDVDDNR